MIGEPKSEVSLEQADSGERGAGAGSSSSGVIAKGGGDSSRKGCALITGPVA